MPSSRPPIWRPRHEHDHHSRIGDAREASSETRAKHDAARVELLLSELRLPGVKLIWAKLAEQSDKEGWPAARFLAALAERSPSACRQDAASRRPSAR